MAKKKKTITKTESKQRFQKTKSFFGNRQTQTIIGLFIVLFSIFLLTSFISYLFNWQQDQSQLTNFTAKSVNVKNLLGKIGASISHFFIYNSLGIAALYLPILLFSSGLLIFLKGNIYRLF
jgi:S-DNA-T family DNA segregation ATPase FtsK/SpoIIIE